MIALAQYIVFKNSNHKSCQKIPPSSQHIAAWYTSAVGQ